MSPPSPSWCLLNCIVLPEISGPFGHYTDEIEMHLSHPLTCVRRQAFGFGKDGAHAERAIKGLAFKVHLADAPAVSSLIIGGGIFASIRTADDNLIVLGSDLPDACSRYIYLIYDAIKQSISMIPSLPELGCRLNLSTRILIARRRCRAGDDGDDGYALVITGQRASYTNKRRRLKWHDALFLWRPPSPSPWEVRMPCFPPQCKGSSGFCAQVAFSCGGHAFWADLLLGVMYCSCDALLSDSGAGGPVVNFGFIDLPVESSRQLTVKDTGPPYGKMPYEYRNMERVGDSTIKFVTIDGFLQRRDFANCTVTVWSLSPDDGDMTWTKEHSLGLGSLAEQEEFKKAGLPTNMVPMYPYLITEEDNVICFALGEYHECDDRSVPGAGRSYFLLRVNMRTGLLLDSARLPTVFSLGHMPDLVVSGLSRYLHNPSGDSEMIKSEGEALPPPA